MGELSITVTIAGRNYKLLVDASEEKSVIEAAEKVNEVSKEFATKYAYKDAQDLLAMTALQFVNTSFETDIKLQEVHENTSAEVERLSAMVTDYLKEGKVL